MTGVGASLHISDHIFAMTIRRLTEIGWKEESIVDYLRSLTRLAWSSGGSCQIDVPRTQHDCLDYEDNLILDLAVHIDASLIVTNDSDLLSLGRHGGWRGRAIMSPSDYTKRAEVAARRRR